MTIKSKFSFLSYNFTPFFDLESFDDSVPGFDDVDDDKIDDVTDDSKEVDDDESSAKSTDDDDDSDDKSDDKDDKREDKKDKGEKDKKDDKKGKEEEQEDEDEEEDDDGKEDEDEEVDENEKSEGRPTIKAIKKAFPEFFKKFPELKHAIFRERAFSQTFGSVEDAQEAAEKANQLDGFTEAIERGDVGTLITSINENLGRDAAVKYAENFLPSLFEVSQKLYAKVTEPVIKQAIRAMYNNGMKSKDKDTVLAARYFAKFYFDDDNVESATKFDTPSRANNEEDNKLKTTQLKAAKTHVDNVIVSKLEKRIKTLIDPEDTMNEFTRDALVDKVVEQVDSLLTKDKSHNAAIKSLWRRAEKDGYVGDALSRIIRAYLGRASQSLPSIIAKHLVDSKNGKKIKAKKDVPSDKSDKSGSKSVELDPRKIDYRRTSDLDILNDKVTVRK